MGQLRCGKREPGLQGDRHSSQEAAGVERHHVRIGAALLFAGRAG